VKLTGTAGRRFCRAPDPACLGVLLHGPDPGVVALTRQDLIAAVTEGDALRLTRLDAGEARKDPAAIDAAAKARGFFPGRRAVLIEGAKDALAQPLGPVLANATPEDALLVVTAEALPPRGALRKLFEGGAALAAIAVYPEVPDAAEIAGRLRELGCRAPLAPEAEPVLAEIVAGLDPGSLRQFLASLALYVAGREAPLAAAEIRALGPAAGDAALDQLINAVAEGRPERIGPVMARLSAGGVQPAQMLIAVGRWFRRMLSAAVDPEGVQAGIGRLRPPVFGARRQALAACIARWGVARLERANRVLFQTERTLRSPGLRPDRAIVERCFLRLAMMGAQR